MTDDPIRNAFASFRADEISRLAAPGVPAARHAVRHRRRLGTGAAAGVTSLLLLGAGYSVAAGTATGPTPTPDQAATVAARDGTATSPPAEPEGTGDDLGELFALVAAALEDELDGPPPSTIFEFGGPMSVAFNPTVMTAADLGVAPDSDRIRVACGGSGAVTIMFRTTADEATVTARCGATAEEITAGAGEASLAFADEPRGDRVFMEIDVDRDETPDTIVVGITPA